MRLANIHSSQCVIWSQSNCIILFRVVLMQINWHTPLFIELFIDLNSKTYNLGLTWRWLLNLHDFCISWLLFTKDTGTQLYKKYPWLRWWFWHIRFEFTAVLNGDSDQSGFTLQSCSMETIETARWPNQSMKNDL